MDKSAVPTRVVVALHPAAAQFFQEIMGRSLQAGLISPDELPVASLLWTSFQQATVVPMAPPQEEVAQVETQP